MSTLKAAEGALSKDSHRWSGVVEGLYGAASNANRETQYASAFPQDVTSDLFGMYNTLQDKVVDLLLGGSREARAIADELLRVDGILRGSDESAKERLEDTWDYHQ